MLNNLLRNNLPNLITMTELIPMRNQVKKYEHIKNTMGNNY